MIVELDRENTKWEALPARRRANYIRTFYVSANICFIWFNLMLILARHGAILYCEI
jgi:hypothetical protein